MNIFTKTQFTEWAEPIPASEVHPPCSRGAIVREPTAMETEGKRNGEEEGRMEHRESDMYMHVLYRYTRRKVGLSLGVQAVLTHFHRRARLFNFQSAANLLSIYPTSWQSERSLRLGTDYYVLSSQ